MIDGKRRITLRLKRGADLIKTSLGQIFKPPPPASKARPGPVMNNLAPARYIRPSAPSPSHSSRAALTPWRCLSRSRCAAFPYRLRERLLDQMPRAKMLAAAFRRTNQRCAAPD